MSEKKPEQQIEVSAKRKKNHLAREMVFLAEQAAEGGLSVVPGQAWGLHYPQEGAVRAERLHGVLEGRYKPEDVAGDLKPDGLVYNYGDIETQGLEAVSARIRDISGRVASYDHRRFAEFVGAMKGKEASLEVIESFFNGITQARAQKKLLDAYSTSGKRQMTKALQAEGEALVKNIGEKSLVRKVLGALKIDWLCEGMGTVKKADRDAALGALSADEKALFEKLKGSYREYVQDGDESAYEKLVKEVQEVMPVVQAKHDEEIEQAEPKEDSESMQDLRKELDPLMDQVGPPGSDKDPGIPPEDRDEYHTPETPQGGEGKAEKGESAPYFEITPPLAGHYAAGRKSFYDVPTKTWSKKKRVSVYSTPLLGGERYTISGKTGGGVKALPLPVGYALDASSLKASGEKPKITRDQNGCFYLETNGSSTFSLDFVKEVAPLASAPITEDTSALYRGNLSKEAEQLIKQATGSIAVKAEQLRAHLLSHHFYPGGGDLQAASALQYKLRNGSTGDNYIQNLEKSEYLECYSANTLFIAMARRAGISARLVIGHRVEGAKNKKSAINSQTGHAWAEIWDGQAWRRFDATPAPKPEDKKPDEQKEKEKQDHAPEAQDGGINPPPEKGEPGEGEPGEGDGEPMDKAGAQDMEQGKDTLEQAKQAAEQMKQQAQELSDKIQKAEKFSQLEKLKEEIEKGELPEDIQKNIEKKMDAKEEELKGEIQDKIDQMAEDGFIDEKQKEQMEGVLEGDDVKELDKLAEQIERGNQLFEQYGAIRREVMPLVDRWFKYFVEHLPKKQEADYDVDSRTRSGMLDRRAITKARNLIFGTVKNPRVIRPSFKPQFLASIMLDVSGSMKENGKLQNAMKLLVFYNELYSKIGREFGYIKFAVNIFSDKVTSIKDYEQEYDSPKRYEFSDGTESTIKVRLMKAIQASGGTNMLDAIKKAAADLSKEARNNPDFASAFYFIGDGGDTQGNSANVKKFLELKDSEQGFGEHLYSAVLMGEESERAALASIFGDDHTTVAPDFEELIGKSMERFGKDIERYLRDKTV